MKCKNCNFTIRTNELEFIDDLECECKYPISVQDCKHLEDTRIRSDLLIIQHTSSGKNFDGLYRAVWEQLKEHCKFCPFCGDELK